MKKNSIPTSKGIPATSKGIGLILTLLVISATGFAFTAFQRRTAEVQQREGLYIFHAGQKPSDDYNYLGTVQSAGVIKNYKPDWVIPHMIKRTKEKYPNAQAIIIVEENNVKCDAITFK